MQIELHKISEQRHALTIVRADGTRERVECETRSFLQHDLLHYATEAEAGVDVGFWGRLAAGATLAELNDKALQGSLYDQPAMLVVEQIVGALTGAIKGRSPDDVVNGLQQLAEAQQIAMPAWLTAAFVERVQARMRGLVGRWNATPFGTSMTLPWPAAAP
ncbi:MAG TPA: hypothetical protein VM261_04585 [Kofleriaceae bacterium]|nr:hypothetical protein [Kofleriaceae bacterium]